MIYRRLLIIALLSFALPALADFTGNVTAVHDGDTITVSAVRVRLVDIDAPELAQPGGAEARDALFALVGQRGVRVSERGPDRYGRILGRIYQGDTDVNARMVEAGHAWVYRQYSRDAALLDLEARARRERRGLWAGDNPVAPWDWRKARP